MEARRAALEALQKAVPVEKPQGVAEIAAAYALDMLEVLRSETLTSAEKNAAFLRFVREIRPEATDYQIALASFRPNGAIPVASAEINAIGSRQARPPQT